MPNVTINGIIIAPSVIKKINNTALSAAYEYAQDADMDNPIIFTSFPNDASITDHDIVQQYIFNHAKVTNRIMAHIWFYHSEYINGKFDMNFLEFIIDNYNITDNILCKDLISNMTDLPILTDDNIITHEYPCCVPYFDKFKYKDSIFPLTANDIEKCADGTYKYIGNLYNIDPNIDYVTITSKSELLKTINEDKRYQNIIIDYNPAGSLVLMEINYLPTTEDIMTWRIGPNCKELTNLFNEYPYEVNISNCQVSHLTTISKLFKGANVHPSIADMKFYSCAKAENCFEASNIKTSPHFYKVTHITRIFNGCHQLENIDNLNSVNTITVFKEVVSGCPMLKNGFCNLQFKLSLLYMPLFSRSDKIKDYLYKNCTFNNVQKCDYYVINNIKKCFSNIEPFQNCKFVDD